MIIIITISDISLTPLNSDRNRSAQGQAIFPEIRTVGVQVYGRRGFRERLLVNFIRQRFAKIKIPMNLLWKFTKLKNSEKYKA